MQRFSVLALNGLMLAYALLPGKVWAEASVGLQPVAFQAQAQTPAKSQPVGQSSSTPAWAKAYTATWPQTYAATWPLALTHLQNNGVTPQSLTLINVLASTLAYHPELEAAFAKQQQADAKLLESQGAFDVKLSSATYYNRYQTASKPGTALKTLDSVTKLAWQSRSGVQLGVGTKLVAGDVSSTFSPTGDGSEPFIELRIPLLRGLGQNEAMAGEQKAGFELSQAEARLLEKRLQLLNKAGESYWKWVTAGQITQVTQRLITLAEVRLQAMRRLAQLGDAAAIEAVEAEQEVRLRESLLASEQSDFLEAAQGVRLFLWEPAGRSLRNEAPDESRLPDGLATLPTLPAGLAENGKLVAYQARPELQVLNLGKQLAEVDWKLARNQLLPQLDAVAIPGYELGANNIGPTLRAGVELSVPLLRRKEKGKQQFARFRLEELSAQERMALAQIQVEINQAVVVIEQAGKQLEKAQQQVALALQVQRAEQRRFELGDSTLFLINTRERQTASAEKEVLKAHKQLMLGWLAFWVASAQL